MLALFVVITSSSSDVLEEHHKTGNQNFSDLLLTSQCISTLPYPLTHAVDETTTVDGECEVQCCIVTELRGIRWSQQHVQSLGC
jgi:hypothetical protein